MGVKVVWCILIVGLLLLAVSSTAKRDTEKEKEEEIRWCKKDCDWKAGADTGKAEECKQQCERRRHGQEDGDSSDDRCGSKCQGHEEWWKKARCMPACKQRQKREGGGNFDIEEIKAKCNEECEHHQRPRRKQRCFDDCVDYELFGGQWFMDMEERIVNSDGRCERMCQHHHDQREKKQCMKDCKYDDGHRHGDHCQTLCSRFRPGSYDRQQCIDKCQRQKPEDDEVMNHHGHGGGGHGHGHGGSSCEEDCQKRYSHGYDKQQCVRDCKSGGGGGAGGRGREGDERRHDWEKVAEAVLKEV